MKDQKMNFTAESAEDVERKTFLLSEEPTGKIFE
jgi:hypothetical protein